MLASAPNIAFTYWNLSDKNPVAYSCFLLNLRDYIRIASGQQMGCCRFGREIQIRPYCLEGLTETSGSTGQQEWRIEHKKSIGKEIRSMEISEAKMT